jgi:hypothetical protein
MTRTCLLILGLTLGSHIVAAQEIIPFPDLSEQYQLHRNGGRSLDERNYSLFSEDYQKALAKLDSEADHLRSLRKEETDQEKIDLYNEQLQGLRKKKLGLLSEAELAEDLQKFY